MIDPLKTRVFGDDLFIWLITTGNFLDIAMTFLLQWFTVLTGSDNKL